MAKKKEKKIHLHCIVDELYGAEVLFAWDCTYQDMEQLVRKYLKTDNVNFSYWKNMAGGVVTLEGEQECELLYVVWVKGKNAFYTLAHECFHLTCNIFDDRFVKFSFDNTEPFAYYQDFWLRKLWRIMSGSEKMEKKK